MGCRLPGRGETHVSANAVRIHRIGASHRKLDEITADFLEHGSREGASSVIVQHAHQANRADANHSSRGIQAVGAFQSRIRAWFFTICGSAPKGKAYECN